jgi:hypothetical protein
MPRLRRFEKSKKSLPLHPVLPRLSDAQYDEIEAKAKRGSIDLLHCPTCKAGHEYEEPGIDLGWPTDSTYRYEGEDRVCDCAWQDELRRRYLLADIPKQYWTYGVGEYYGDSDAWIMAQGYLTAWNPQKEAGLGLEFYSEEMGTGKTFLMCYIARQLIQRGEDVFFSRFSSIMGLYQGDSKEIQDRLLYSTVLALDEVGIGLSGAQGEYFAMEFENLIRNRIDSNRVTLMTTNLTPKRLNEHYPRTYSLLSAKQSRCALNGFDVRKDYQEIEKSLIDAGEVRPIQ